MSEKIKLIDDFKPRLYQETIFNSCIDKNSLVVLPTGLGKTVIALMLVTYYFNTTGKKILFLAPTKPLVQQQEKSFAEFFENSQDLRMKVLTGSIAPSKRLGEYEQSDIIFSTPQVIENDIINQRFNLSDFALVVFDEAHRATGDYSYVYIHESFFVHGVKNLALTASPGTDKQTIDVILTNLNIENIQIKSEEDEDVKPYVYEKKITDVKIKLPEEFKEIQKDLSDVFADKKRQIEELLNMRFNNSKKDLLMLMQELRQRIAQGENEDRIWKSIALSSGLLKLQHLIELFETQEICVAYNFYNQLHKESAKVKGSQELFRTLKFVRTYERVSVMYRNKVRHPKILKLKELVLDELGRNSDLKIIIFSQYRETAQVIERDLSEIKEIRPAVFVGQAKKNDLAMSQKKQKQVLDDFRENRFNVLISTSIGEEGLDIPKVDLVIFYEPIPSAIRTIQRIGRTGRFKRGEIFLLLAEGTRDIAFKYIAKRKEKNMYEILKKLVKDSDAGKLELQKRKSLKDFIGGLGVAKSGESVGDGLGGVESKRIVDLGEQRFLIYVDNRELNSFKKELLKFPFDLKSKQLEIADVVINDSIGIERKSAKDFLGSLVDKRLFKQLSNLCYGFRKPVLIIENKEDLYLYRNIKKDTIDNLLVNIMVGYRIPVIFSNGIDDTARIIFNIARRENKRRDSYQLAKAKPGGSNRDLEAFVAGVPGFNLKIARSLLKSFKSIRSLVNSKDEQLRAVEGIGDRRAESLIGFFNKEYDE